MKKALPPSTLTIRVKFPKEKSTPRFAFESATCVHFQERRVRERRSEWRRRRRRSSRTQHQEKAMPETVAMASISTNRTGFYIVLLDRRSSTERERRVS